jgi:hypothetical protein
MGAIRREKRQFKREVSKHLEHFNFLSEKFEKTVSDINNNTPYEILFKEYNKSWVQYCNKVDWEVLDPRAFHGKYAPYNPSEELGEGKPNRNKRKKEAAKEH